jgi:uncharacterized membrane protein
MSKGRLEAFSDGVLAIIITIMVLELRPPHEISWEALLPLVPVFMSYVLSFIFVGIYWNNHHHMLQAARRVDGRVLWANLHLLFWLSLIPFVTAWMGESFFATWPVAIYGVILFVTGFAYYVLERALTSVPGQDVVLAQAFDRRTKEWLSLGGYALAVPLAFVNPWISIAIYAAVAAIWFLPDLRIERQLK